MWCFLHFSLTDKQGIGANIFLKDKMLLTWSFRCWLIKKENGTEDKMLLTWLLRCWMFEKKNRAEDLHMISSWRVHDMFMTYSWLVCDLFMTLCEAFYLYWHEWSALQSVAVRRSTGNDVRSTISTVNLIFFLLSSLILIEEVLGSKDLFSESWL